MGILFYIFWRSFNSYKEKGLFLNNILLLLTMEFITLSGCLFIVIEKTFDLNMRQHLPSIRSANPGERYLSIAIFLVLFSLIYKTLSYYYVRRYERIIKENDRKFGKVGRHLFILLFLAITFTLLLSPCIAEVVLAKK